MKLAIGFVFAKGNAMKKYILILISLMGCASFAASEKKEFDAAGLSGVLLSNISGNVVISSTQGPKAIVLANKGVFAAECKMIIERVVDTLVVKVERTSSSAQCAVDFQLLVPNDVDVDLTVNYGNTTVRGIQGELEFIVGSGNITADGIFKKIDGESGSGNVDVTGLVGGGRVRTGSGGVDLTFVVSSLSGELDLRTGSGNATIAFPKGTKIKTTFAAGSGQLINELGDAPDAAFKVSMRAGSGNLNIKSF